jgi:hypothetical protein
MVSPTQVFATVIQVVIEGNTTGQMGYAYARAKIGTTISKQTRSDPAGTVTPLSATGGPLSVAGKSASAASTVTSTASSTTLQVDVTNAGSNTLAEGTAQKGLTYASASEVLFTLLINDIRIDEIPSGEGVTLTEYHINNLMSDGSMDQLDCSLLPPDADIPPGFIPTCPVSNFFNLQVSSPADLSSLFVSNTLGPGARLVSGKLLTTSDFIFHQGGGGGDIFGIQQGGAWQLNGSRTLVVGITQPTNPNAPLTAGVLVTTSVPEPTTIVLLGVGMILLVWTAWTRQRRLKSQEVRVIK